MRALTLTQPWAGLVASGIKLVENRPRSMIKREDFGKPFAIHASREINVDTYDRVVEISPELATHVVRNGERILTFDMCHPWYRLAQITSAVIAVATIDYAVSEFNGVANLHTGMPADLGDQRRWFFGPVGYVLRDVHALATPVPCRGALGFWTLSDDVERAVVEQLR